MHVIVATYVQEHIVEDDEPIGQEALRTAHGRAAQYYLRQAAVNCPPKERAKEYLEQALSIVEKEESTRGKGTTLNNLGKVCAELGETEQAREYLEQSLVIRREKGYRAGEGKTLRNLGSVYKALDQIKQAQKCYQDSLNIFRGLGDREEEGATLYEIGMLYFEQEFYDNALAYFLLARNRFEEVQTPHQDVIEKQLGILRIKMGKKRFDASLASIKPDALRIVEQVLHKEK